MLAVAALTLFQTANAVRSDTGAAWPLSAVDIAGNYDGEGVRIAVIDTGVSTKHIDPKSILPGKNYVFPGVGTDDLIGHGTSIAGIILGSKDMGLKGVAPDARIVPLVYYSVYPSGVPIDGGAAAIASAVDDAVDVFGCRIINISSGMLKKDDTLMKALKHAEEKGVLVISSVGNDNRSSPDIIYYPAAIDTVVGVGAAGKDLSPAPFSQRNSSVMLLAPGEAIPAVTNRNSSKPQTVSGTSYAAAYVTGAAALLLQENPSLTAPQLREILRKSAKDIGKAGCDTDSGWGLLDVYAAEAISARTVQKP